MSAGKNSSDNEQRTRRSTPTTNDTSASNTPTKTQAWPRRRRLATDTGNQISRTLAAALIVIVAGGAYLFWPRGNGAPMGIGEQITVITDDSTASDRPRSGSVDIQMEHQPLVAEKPLEQPHPAKRASLPTGTETLPTIPATSPPGPAPSQPAQPQPAQPQPDLPRPEPAQPQPAPAQPRPPAPAPQEPTQPARRTAETTAGSIEPHPTGGWAVQVGAYGTEANAEAMANRLKAAGINAQVRAASTSSGELIFRVWIGWFQSRDQAQAYAVQERSRIGEAHPVHR